jgi:hypothetical protein
MSTEHSPSPVTETGTRVERTGIALVHEGEYIVPAAGSTAELAPAAAAGGPDVHYYFPMEIEVVGELDDAMVARVADQVFAELDRELSSRR